MKLPASWMNLQRLDHGQVHVSFVVLLSETVHFVVPGGDCKEADPAWAELSSFISTRRPGLFSSMVIELPFLVTLPVPVYTVPPQQNE